MLFPPLSKWVVICSFAPELLSTFCMSCIVLGTTDTKIHKADGTLALPEVIWRESPTAAKGLGHKPQSARVLAVSTARPLEFPLVWPIVQ